MKGARSRAMHGGVLRRQVPDERLNGALGTKQHPVTAPPTASSYGFGEVLTELVVRLQCNESELTSPVYLAQQTTSLRYN